MVIVNADNNYIYDLLIDHILRLLRVISGYTPSAINAKELGSGSWPMLGEIWRSGAVRSVVAASADCPNPTGGRDWP
jgi:hypothetical protein